LKLGTKLTIYLSCIIVLVLSGYGYLHILSRRELLVKKMKLEVRSIGHTLKISLERTSYPGELKYVQDLLNAVDENDRTLGALFYHQDRDLILHSHTIEGEFDPLLESIKRVIRESRPQESFGFYKKVPVFIYTFPLKDEKGNIVGGVALLQHTSFVEEDIEKAEWSIFIATLILIGGTIVLILFATRRWITQPISVLMDGIKNMARGDLNIHIDLKKRGDELSKLSQAFNQMAIDLREAQERMTQESETRLDLERSLRQSEKLAMIGQLASGLAHEIGTPLNVIGGRAEMTKKKLEDKETVLKNLDVIVQQSARITKIIQQLLGFVRKKKPEQSLLNVPELLETTLEFLSHQIQKQRVSVAREIADNLPSVKGDPDQLQQVFLNTILNAIQAMPQGGTLRLSVLSKWLSKADFENEKRQYVEVCIEDTGVGIEKEIIPNIFNPFFTTKNRGTGLGLMISQGIVQDHEGWIDVESEVGEGSVFKIYLPVSQG